MRRGELGRRRLRRGAGRSAARPGAAGEPPGGRDAACGARRAAARGGEASPAHTSAPDHQQHSTTSPRPPPSTLFRARPPLRPRSPLASFSPPCRARRLRPPAADRPDRPRRAGRPAHPQQLSPRSPSRKLTSSSCFPTAQLDCPQVDRPRPHGHQPEDPRQPPRALQGQEAPARPPCQEDPCHPPPSYQGASFLLSSSAIGARLAQPLTPPLPHHSFRPPAARAHPDDRARAQEGDPLPDSPVPRQGVERECV